MPPFGNRDAGGFRPETAGLREFAAGHGWHPLGGRIIVPPRRFPPFTSVRGVTVGDHDFERQFAVQADDPRSPQRSWRRTSASSWRRRTTGSS